MNKLLFVILGLVLFGVDLISQSTIEGKITDQISGEPISFATLALYKNGVLRTGTDTDLDGNYFISGLDPGTYDVEASYLGYTNVKQTGVLLKAGGTTRLNFEMNEGGVLVDEIVVIAYKVPLIEVDNTTTGTVITSEKINTLPVKSINGLVATAAGVSSRDGSTPSIRGSRTNETVYFIDGVRTFGSIPQTEIDQLQLVTGGIEAKYGDVTGGIISITTKGPSNKLSGSFEAETSEYLDGFGYNLYRAALSGPLLRNKKKRSILGYRLAAQFRSTADDFPNANGVYRASESLISELEANPLYQIGTTSLPAAQLLKNEDIGSTLKARPNETDKNINLNAKIDAAIGPNIDVSISGNYTSNEDRFTPGGSWGMFNWTNNPFNNTSRLRTNLRIRHKLGRQYSADGERNRTPSVLRNFEYTLTGGYERGSSSSQDYRHEDRFFDYGFIGNTEVTWDPIFGVAPFDGVFQFGHLGYTENIGEFTPGTVNPTLSILNDENGISRSENNVVWSDLFRNVGQVYDLNSKSESDLYSFNLNASFDLLPGGSEKGRHSIQFGLVYEQRIQRSYSLSPFGLWRLGDILVNNHIKGIDRNVVVDSMSFNTAGGEVFFPIYETLLEEDASSLFYKSIREKLGISDHEYVNIHGLNPEDLSLDLFSPGELNNQGLINYRGYDYLGNKLTEPTSFEDFFRRRDADGRREFPVAPFSPIYGGVYLQDKFSYKDIIFRLGVRVDYYDANTKVLKDPYAIYEIESAENFFDRTGKLKPESVGDDYKVYVAGDESDNVIGYRQGDNWFSPNGTEVSGGNVIFNGGVVYPSYVGRFKDSEGNQRELNIQSEDFDPNTAFDDYKPQINVMPRFAFSFPISDEAGFFAHYDVLYQRPTSNVVMTGLDYFYFNDISSSGPANNPNLKPQRTIDYEAGFQQKLSNTTAVKLSAYYKAFKDLIQQRAYANVASPINSYFSYGNLDFGNITGFTAQFDRRRTSNLELTGTYTLQFANGSGSSANSSGGINNRGPIRNLLPLGFDERHRLTAIIDFRYGEGKRYNGPTVGNFKIFENMGINLSTIAVSGRPYTKAQTPSSFAGTGYVGEINGSRLPWNVNLDTRIDKTISIKISEKGKPLYANIYLRVQNLLNTKNIRSVYSASGSPDDDGYLLSNLGLDRRENIQRNGLDLLSFDNSYNWLLSTNGNYFLPRRIYLGLQFDF